ncbi:MAG TPA: hypothetical protein V6C58_09360, partial [Allocoleopsis sp.]
MSNYYIVGILAVLVATAGVIIYNSQNNIIYEINETATYLYLCENNLTNCTIGGIENWKLYNDSEELTGIISIEQTFNNNKTNTIRTVNYNNYTYIIFNYSFDGEVLDIEQFPVSNKITF